MHMVPPSLYLARPALYSCGLLDWLIRSILALLQRAHRQNYLFLLWGVPDLFPYSPERVEGEFSAKLDFRFTEFQEVVRYP